MFNTRRWVGELRRARTGERVGPRPARLVHAGLISISRLRTDVFLYYVVPVKLRNHIGTMQEPRCRVASKVIFAV